MPNFDQAAWERSREEDIDADRLEQIRQAAKECDAKGNAWVLVETKELNALLDEVLAARVAVKGIQ